ncbi:MAG: PKD domain-containing protein [Planctomycetota bacterium]
MAIRLPIPLLASAALLALPLAAQQSRLATVFASDNGGSDGGAVYLDATVQQPILVQDVEINVGGAPGVPLSVTVYGLPDGVRHLGNETTGAWIVLGVDDGTAVSAGLDRPSRVPLLAPFELGIGTRGIAIVVSGAGHRYTNGNGTNQSYSDAVLGLTLGAASNQPFTGPVFTPRVWNGSIGYAPVQGVQPWFYVTARRGPSPFTVTMFDRSSTTAPGGIVSYDWDVDSDGIYDYSGPSATHTYTTGGHYDITLRITDGTFGATTLTRQRIVEVDPILADFTTTPVPGVPLQFQFTDASQPAPSTWAWDFDGDGQVDSTQQNPVFDYPSPGVFRCVLQVSSATNTATATRVVRVQTVPLPSFTGTYSFPTSTRGLWFRAPARFSIVGLEVPDEFGHGLQNVAVYRLPSAPPAAPGAIAGELRFLATGVQSGQQIRTAISFAAGDFVGVLGTAGDANESYSSYGVGAFVSDLLGTPITLSRLAAESNLVTSGGGAPLSGGVGPLGRVELAITSSTSSNYGTGTASGTGAAAPTLATTRMPMLGRTARVAFDQHDNGAIGAMLIAFGRGSVITPFGELLLDPATMFSFPIGPVANGQGVFDLQVPNVPSLQGAGPVCMQAIFAVIGAPNPVTFSDAVEWYLGT